MASKLSSYRKRRNFRQTPEPKGSARVKGEEALFVIQKHHASHLHYDLRLQIAGTLKSWAVPKGAPKKIGEKRLAVSTEDHPIEYANFSGIIPEGHYGAGKVEIWDRGIYENLKSSSIKSCLKKGVIEVALKGKRLKGRYSLVHFKEKNWLWIKLKSLKSK